MKTRIAIGHVLRQRRKDLNLSLREVNPNVSYSYLSEIERGKKDASSDLLDVISKSLDYSPAEFMLAVANVLHQDERKLVETA